MTITATRYARRHSLVIDTRLCRRYATVRAYGINGVNEMTNMTPTDVIHAITTTYSGLVPKQSWGETSLFYNPDTTLTNGVYFCTIKEHDGANDMASQLNRLDIFRLSFGLPTTHYERLFGVRPPRPSKGGCVATGHDFTVTDILQPHPIYAWMGWVQVLSPSTTTFTTLQPLLSIAYEYTTHKYTNRTKRNISK